jgi:beta-lactam-binding protein with PASTA domain
VPNIVGMTQVQAQAALAAVGLALGTVTSEFSDTVAAGLILRQTPSSGTIAASGGAVAVVLSKGPQSPTVPNVVGMTQVQAQTALAAVGLALGTVTSEFSGTVAAGLVLGQMPLSGTAVPPGTAVAVILSKGPQTVTVPAVVGMTQTQAQDAFAVSGLVMGTVGNEFSSTVSIGIVLSQDPAAGLGIAPGSAVNVVVSKGPQTVSVPNVVGMAQVAAQYELVAAGLVLGMVTSRYSATVAAGVVITQNPAAGLAEIPGTAVNLVVSSGSSTTSVPTVAGMTQTAAQNTITTAGLALGTVSHEYSDAVELGFVIRQTPEAGSTANAGEQVSIVVSDGPAPSGCFGGSGKALGQGSKGANGLVLGAALALVSVLGRP